MVRDSWLNLNGIWEFEFDPGCSGAERGLPQTSRLSREILVPFCPESTLSGIGDTDFHPAVWYRRTFYVPEDWEEGRALLHVGASDYETTVWVNGHQAGQHRGGFTPITCDITPWLQRGENLLVISARDDVRSGLQPGGKQSWQYNSFACLYTRTTGIWQTVWIEAVPSSYLDNLRLTPDLPNGRVLIEADIAGGATEGTLEAQAALDGQPVGQVLAHWSGQHVFAVVPLSEVRPWGPGSPTLYDLELILTASDSSIDRVHSYFGLRSLGIEGAALLLNGAPLFQRLVLDQGFYPDGIYTAPNDEALRQDILLSQAMGFNGARLHQKVFEPRFLYWADRLGYLVWGEYPNWGLDIHTARGLEIYLPEWMEAMRRDFSHPSIVGWCPFNETPTDQDPEVLRTVYRASKALDATRPVIDTSGYVHVETDIYDIHNYEQHPDLFAAAFAPFAAGGEPFRNFPQHGTGYKGQPYFVSEYGGIWWNPGQRDDRSWGYGGEGGRPKSEQEFLERYRGLTEVLLKHPRMCAFCYTQLYDVEQEVNGLYTYHRQAKFAPELIRAINSQTAAIER